MTENYTWLNPLTELIEKKIPCALITVVDAKGSTPRESGTKMVVSANGQFGTIGGGNLEFQAVEKARELLGNLSAEVTLKNYPLGPALAQCCGGTVTVMLEPFIPSNKGLLIFGAGHIGKELVKVLEGLPIDIKWIDSRAEEFPEQISSNVSKIAAVDSAAELELANENSFIVVMTHNHDLDYVIVKTALENKKFAYLGMVGSKTKRVKFENKLIADGVDKNVLDKLVCPLGIESLRGKHPREIAISLAAQLLQRELLH